MRKIILYILLPIFTTIVIACNENVTLTEPDKTLETVDDNPHVMLDSEEKLLIGQWRFDFTHFDLQADHSYIKSFPDLDPDKIETGTWQLLADKRVEFKPDATSEIFQRMEDNSETYQFVLQEDTLMIDDSGYSAYRKLDDFGHPLPIAETNTDVPLPLFDEEQVMAVHLHQMTSLAPSINGHSRYNLVKNEQAFAGHATVTGAEEIEQVRTLSDTTTVSIPLSDMQLFLGHISNASLVKASYRDDICVNPSLYRVTEITLIFENKTIHLCSIASQPYTPTEPLPWYVQIDGEQYRSYSDEVELGLAVIDPFLVHDVETRLYDEVQSIYETEVGSK